ncbi:uracil-DNA glycosylase [Pseudohoeflea suaedae]|uniref:Type-4 uracil-DNA glycosylase n=1 Tax=Pseudohoeflea suaedae TaxID=877384 RepID=A0A4R5PP67_9HYPH|nr:uracil-DNA glycosylase [Pseudohoeflea suaedae]TDH38874.1 uracil-DNA glycosylase [Pseudohoeflea suaedae]
MTVSTEPTDAGALEALMMFYADAGVDTPLEDLPVDRFAESQEEARKRQAARATARPAGSGAQATQQDRGRQSPGQNGAARQPTPKPPGAPQQLTVPDAAAFEDARATAKAANTVAELQAALENYNGCNLKHSARNTVFMDGNPEARLMIVGEAPGRDEDLQGLPFVGRAGQLLDRMLAAIGQDRTSVCITNVIYWRPPGNRTPTAHEVELCRPFAERHIELIKPDVLLFLGNVPTKALLKTDKGILSIRGRFQTYERDELAIPALPSLHPAYLLRSPAQKKLAWADLLALSDKLGATR